MTGSCYEEVDWLSFIDDEVDGAMRGLMTRHVTSCETCKRKLTELAELLSWGDQNLSAVFASSMPWPSEQRSRVGKRVGSHLRRRMVVTGVAAAAVIAAVFVPGPKVWADILQVFSASHVDAVQVTASDMLNLQNALTQRGKVSMKQYGSLVIVKPMTYQQGTTSGYAAQTGLPDLWPKAFATDKQITVTTNSAAEYVFTLNVAHVNALVQSVGGSQLFPASLNGVPITIHEPTGVDIYDSKDSSTNTGYALSETGVPSMSIPSGIDVAQSRQALLALPFLPQSIVQALASMTDWRSTVVMPVYGTITKHVSFLGQDAELISDTHKNQQVAQQYTLVWDTGQVIVSFSQMYTGTVTADQFLQHAKELFG